MADWLPEICRARSARGCLRIAKALRFLHSVHDSSSPYLRALEAGCGYPEREALSCAEQIRLSCWDTPPMYRACGQLLNASKACHDGALGWQLALAAGSFGASEHFPTPEQRMMEIAAEMVANLRSGKWGYHFWTQQGPRLRYRHHGYVSLAAGCLLSNCIAFAETDAIAKEALRGFRKLNTRDYQTRQVREVAERNAQLRAGRIKGEPEVLHSYYHPY